MDKKKEKKEKMTDPTKAWEEDLAREDMPLMREMIDLLCEITQEETIEAIRYVEAARKNEEAKERGDEPAKNPLPMPEGEYAQMFIELCVYMLAKRKKRELMCPSDARETEGRQDIRTPEPPNSLPQPR